MHALSLILFDHFPYRKPIINFLESCVEIYITHIGSGSSHYFLEFPDKNPLKRNKLTSWAPLCPAITQCHYCFWPLNTAQNNVYSIKPQKMMLKFMCMCSSRYNVYLIVKLLFASKLQKYGAFQILF